MRFLHIVNYYKLILAKNSVSYWVLVNIFKDPRSLLLVTLSRFALVRGIDIFSAGCNLINFLYFLAEVSSLHFHHEWDWEQSSHLKLNISPNSILIWAEEIIKSRQIGWEEWEKTEYSNYRVAYYIQIPLKNILDQSGRSIYRGEKLVVNLGNLKPKESIITI